MRQNAPMKHRQPLPTAPACRGPWVAAATLAPALLAGAVQAQAQAQALTGTQAHRSTPVAAAAQPLGPGAPAGGSAAPASVQRGKALLAQYQCGSCHAIPGVPAARGDVAQPLRAWGRRSYIAGRLPNRPDILAQWITDPQSLVPGTAMPRMGVSPADARHIAAYLFSLE